MKYRPNREARGRPFLLLEQPGARDVIVALHGFRQRVDGPGGLPGRLGLPFPEFTGFARLPAHVCYPLGKWRNWRERGERQVCDDLDYAQACAVKSCAEVRARRLFVFGFSDGGTFAHLLFERFWRPAADAVLAGACVASGWVPPREWQPSRLNPIVCRDVPLGLCSGALGPIELRAAMEADAAEKIYRDAGATNVGRFFHDAPGHDWPVEQCLPWLAWFWGLPIEALPPAAPD